MRSNCAEIRTRPPTLSATRPATHTTAVGVERHGPVGIAVRFTPDGRLDGAIVTHATEETVSWVKDVVDAGLLDQFRGKTLATIDGALVPVRDRFGRMPAYMGEVIVRGVARATALRRAAYAG